MAKFYKAVGNKYCIFPVGSIYLTVVDVNPTKWYGGTWVKQSGGFIYGVVSAPANSTITGTSTGASSGSTGASSAANTGSTALTIDQIPSHTHGIWMVWEAGRANGSMWTYNADKNWGTHVTNATGGGAGHTHPMAHTHSLNSHTHAVPYIGVWVWKRTA